MGGMLWALVAGGPRSSAPRLDRLQEERLKGEGLVAIDIILRSYLGSDRAIIVRIYVCKYTCTYECYIL